MIFCCIIFENIIGDIGVFKDIFPLRSNLFKS